MYMDLIHLTQSGCVPVSDFTEPYYPVHSLTAPHIVTYQRSVFGKYRLHVCTFTPRQGIDMKQKNV